MNMKSGTLIAVFAVMIVFVMATFASAACATCQAAAAKGKLKEVKQDWAQERTQIHDQLIACKNDSNKTECKQEIVDRTRVYLENVSETLCSRLDTMEERVNKAKNLTDEEKTAVLGAIAEAKTRCSEIQSEIGNATTKQEMKDAIKDMRNLIIAVRVKTLELIKEKRIGLIIEKAEHLETKLNKTLEKANAANISTADLGTLVDNFNAKIAEARTDYNASQDLWTQVFDMIANKTIEGRPEIVQQAQDKMQAAQSALKDANAILKDIVAKIREMKLQVAAETNGTGNETNQS